MKIIEKINGLFSSAIIFIIALVIGIWTLHSIKKRTNIGLGFKQERNRVWDILFLCVTIFLVFYIGFYVSQSYFNATINDCNQRYGKDNWNLVEITGNRSEEFYKGNPLFIGQVWKCISK
jgi:hypothetical protein